MYHVLVSVGARRFVSMRIGTSVPSIVTSVFKIALSHVSQIAIPPWPSGRSFMIFCSWA